METVLRERLDPGIEVLRLNRPDRRNALDSATLELLVEALAELALDPSVRVVVLSSTSILALCAGIDV
ncbi:MAG TPA: enoyl-CoA hydratase/isomerase family protein, partial [Solirubrobacteraceae bacterium]|nr:enoyl-CoA hydratase/isomerase family protein [Solirubrobacteraceae bacterium]